MSHGGAALPALYTAEQVRALDRRAIENHGIPGIVLMQRAGRALWRVVEARMRPQSVLHVLCGTGNNGGDGFILARLAAERGIRVQLQLVGERERVGGDAGLACGAALAAGVEVLPFSPSRELGDGLVVDALLGTGLKGEVRSEHRLAIDTINASGLPVIAVDIPSGLCSDTGSVLGVAVRASATATFIGRKRGLYTGAAADHCGEIVFDDLEVPATVYEGVEPGAELLRLAGLPLPRPRERGAHKGSFGHVLVIGGNQGMAGAAAMAAEAAARVGAGLVSVATRPESVAAVVARCPVVMARAVSSARELDPLLERASVIVAGPGLGRDAWAEQLLARALAVELPTVLDADALNLLAASGARGQENWLITPHPGEAARLLGTTAAAVNADRFRSLEALRQRFPGAVLLKGAGTLVAAGACGRAGVVGHGNPGMASGGMGDVLSGVLGGLLAQKTALGEAARLGACLHARSADLEAARRGERGLLATDLLPWLRQLVNRLDEPGGDGDT